MSMIKEIENRNVNENQLIIYFIGQSGCVLKIKDSIIYIDPYLTDYIENSAGVIADLPKSEKPPIETALEWSKEVNRMVKATVFNLPPISGSLKAITFLHSYADLVVISNTPIDTLQREWSENNIEKNVLYIGGQETGTKTEMLVAVAKNKYAQDNILIIGDSPGDLIAAQAINALFFPILQSKEEESWHNFNTEGCEIFLNGIYSGSYQNEQINQFQSSLDTIPTWLT